MRIEGCVDGASGLVSDWELLEKMLFLAQQQYLKIDYAEAPIIVSEKPYCTPGQRHRMCETLFETLKTPAAFLCKDAVLACYAVGKTSGLVIDVGASGTCVTPVLDGWAETRNTMRSAIGGRYMDNYLFNLIKKRMGVAPIPHFRLQRSFDSSAGLVVTPCVTSGVTPSYDALMNLELARDLKDTVCKMADTTLTEASSRYSSIPTTPYELPDGTLIDMGIERFMVSELLCGSSPGDASFSSDDLDVLGITKDALFVQTNENADSIPRLVLDSVLRCEIEAQSNLFSNIVVAGGGSCFEGLPERFKSEIEKVVHLHSAQSKVKVSSGGNSERATCAWLGGSILGSLGSFHEMWFTKAEYEEFGPQLVDRKCS
jgi:actin-like protein 6A